MLDGATVRVFTCLASNVAVVPSARLSTTCVGVSLAMDPVSVSPLASCRVTMSKPAAMCALGLRMDSSRYWGVFSLAMRDRFGPASPPSEPTT
jgi:hypothetical protein